MKLTRIAVALICFISMFGCSLEKNVETENAINNIGVNSQEETNTKVEIKMLRINPSIQKKLDKTTPSRAYAVADKVKVIVKKGETVVKEEEYEVGSYGENNQSFYINMGLPADNGYKMYIESFNLNNSSDIPTVKGESGLFNVLDGAVSDIIITMLPHLPGTLTLERIETISPNAYTYININTNASGLYKTGAEYWYKLTADSSITEIYTNPITFASKSITKIEPEALITVFNSDGTYVSSQAEFNSSFLFNSTKGMEYYINVLPLAYDNWGEIYKSDVISLNSRNFTDGNSSKETAREISLAFEVEDCFTGAYDEGFFKIYLEPGKYDLFSPSFDIIEIYNESGNIISKFSYSALSLFNETIGGVFEVQSAGNYYIKTIGDSALTDTLKSYNFIIFGINISQELNPSAQWYELDSGNGDSIEYYPFIVDPNKEYSISVETDSNSSYTALMDLGVIALEYNEADNKFIRKSVSEGTSSLGSTMNIPPGVTKVYLENRRVHIPGTFAVKLEEVVPVYKTVTLGEVVTSSAVEGLTQYYSFDVTPNQSLNVELSTNYSYSSISGYPTATGEAFFCLYDSPKTEYFFTNVVSMQGSEYIVKDGVNKLILKVVHDPYFLGNVLFRITDNNAAS